MERRLPLVVLVVRVGALANEQLCELLLAVLGSDDEESVAVLVGGVDVKGGVAEAILVLWEGRKGKETESRGEGRRERKEREEGREGREGRKGGRRGRREEGERGRQGGRRGRAGGREARVKGKEGEGESER